MSKLIVFAKLPKKRYHFWQGPIAIHRFSIFEEKRTNLPNEKKTKGRGTEKKKWNKIKEKRRKRKGRRAKEERKGREEREKNACDRMWIRHIATRRQYRVCVWNCLKAPTCIHWIFGSCQKALKQISQNFLTHLGTLQWHVCYDSCYSMMICDGSWIKTHLSRLCISAATFDCNWDMLFISATRLERNSNILQHVRTRAANMCENMSQKNRKIMEGQTVKPLPKVPKSPRHPKGGCFQTFKFSLWHPLTS